MQPQVHEAQAASEHDEDLQQRGWPAPALCLTVATGLLVGLVLVYQGIHKGYFDGVTEVDDAIYYGEGALMAHGILPYHSYIDVQTPGIALLMAPFGFLGRLTSGRVGFEWARVFMVVVAVANVGLLGRLIRRRHWAGILTGLGILGFYEDSLIAEHTLLLEPLLVLTTLLAFLLVFDDVEVATGSSARWLWAGALLGLTTSIKIWGVFPFVVLLYFAFRQGRRCLTRFVVGGVVAFAVISGPFFAVAPSAFWHEVFVVQATRAHINRNPFDRLGSLLGITGHVGVALALWLLLGLCIVGSLLLARRSARNWPISNLDAAALACAVIVGASFLVSPEFDPHYGGFLAPFIALVFSATAVRLLPLARTFMPILITAVMVVFIGHSVRNVVDEARVSGPNAAVAAAFSPKACVISPVYGPVILANRYNLYESTCPHVVDLFGTELTDGGGVAGVPADGQDPKLQTDWLDWLHHADGLVLEAPLSQYSDIGAAAKAEVRSNFSLVAKSDGLYIYRRVPPD